MKWKNDLFQKSTKPKYKQTGLCKLETMSTVSKINLKRVGLWCQVIEKAWQNIGIILHYHKVTYQPLGKFTGSVKSPDH